MEALAKLIENSGNFVVFTGAGMSTESGIPDFRSPGGLWSRWNPPMFQEFMAKAEARSYYWRFYREMFKDLVKAKPNEGHLALGRLFAAGKLKAVVTQNVDGLHQAGGVSPEAVVELHGATALTTCFGCGRHRENTQDVLKRIENQENADPACPLCGGPLKPATISFGQSLDEAVLKRAIDLCRDADLLLVVGSSLVVQPAAGLPLLTLQNGGRLAVINRESTPMDHLAAMVAHASAGPILSGAADIILKKHTN